MAEEATKLRLGRGLAALIGDVGDELRVVERARGARKVPIEFLRPNPRNPRKNFAEGDLGELAASIRERGIVQPIVVRPLPDLPDGYEIVAGERRWRAAQMAGLHEVPVVVVEIDDRTSLEYAIVENVQRADLNAIEEAQGYQRLMDEFGYTQAELVDGPRQEPVACRQHPAAPAPAGERAASSSSATSITAGHARALLAVARSRGAWRRRIVEKNLSVREVEEIAHAEHGNAEPQARPGGRQPQKDPDTRAVEQALEDVLGLARLDRASRRGRRAPHPLRDARAARRPVPAPEGGSGAVTSPLVRALGATLRSKSGQLRDAPGGGGDLERGAARDRLADGGAAAFEDRCLRASRPRAGARRRSSARAARLTAALRRKCRPRKARQRLLDATAGVDLGAGREQREGMPEGRAEHRPSRRSPSAASAAIALVEPGAVAAEGRVDDRVDRKARHVAHHRVDVVER